MAEKIAVTADRNNQTASLESSVKILLYQKTNSGEWQLNHEIDWRLSQGAGRQPACGDALPAVVESDIPGIRDHIRMLIEQFEDCRIIVSRKITGIPYHIFDKTGFHIFETNELPSQNLFLDIIREIETAEAENQASLASAVAGLSPVSPGLSPVSPGRDGNYYLNLVELQRAHPEISSKKALRQFMEETVFNSLELICNHMPPWLEAAAASKNYNCRIEKADDQTCKVTIINPYIRV